MPALLFDLDPLTPAERRDLANALLRGAWFAALPSTRLVLLDALEDADLELHGEES